jgi:hypothetical protein
MSRRSDIDWGPIEVEFRVGAMPIRQIARKYGVADSNLRRRATQEGWTRDAGDAARRAARQEIAASSTECARQIGAEIGAKQAQAYRATLEEAVLSSMQVEREHQVAARRGMELAMRLLEELESACACTKMIQAEIEACGETDSSRAALIDRQLGIKARVDALDKWAGALSRVTGVERQAHRLDAEEKGNEIDAFLLRIHREREKDGEKQ